jgi:hypothetical protein
MKPSAWSSRQIFSILSVICLFTCLLAACGTGGSMNSTATSSNKTEKSALQQAASASGGPGVQPCPEAVQASSYWAPLVNIQPDVSNVEEVKCANLAGGNELQALVTVRTLGTSADLDLYVFTHITQPQPSQLFKILGLYKGEVKISSYNTLMTGEVDSNSSVNKGINTDANLQQDLFREFKWSEGAETFVPVSFPGIYPDLTRFQAEMDQQTVNQGQDTWKLDAAKTASHLTVDLLQWPTTSNTSVASGGGKGASDAVVNVKSPSVAGGSVQVTLSRLEGNTNNGIWIVTDVSGPDLTIATPIARDLISSPIKVTGKGKAFEAVIGKLMILDHTYSDIGDAQAKGAVGTGDTTFATSVSYTPSFKNGMQEGIIVLLDYSNADGLISSAAMRKVLIAV